MPPSTVKRRGNSGVVTRCHPFCKATCIEDNYFLHNRTRDEIRMDMNLPHPVELVCFFDRFKRCYSYSGLLKHFFQKISWSRVYGSYKCSIFLPFLAHSVLACSLLTVLSMHEANTRPWTEFWSNRSSKVEGNIGCDSVGNNACLFRCPFYQFLLRNLLSPGTSWSASSHSSFQLIIPFD